MQPLTMVTGIILGTAFAIAFGLAVVLFLFTILGTEFPQVAAERGGLLRSVAMFSALTVVAGASFLGLLKERRWSWYLQGAMWLLILLIAWYYWPR